MFSSLVFVLFLSKTTCLTQDSTEKMPMTQSVQQRDTESAKESGPTKFDFSYTVNTLNDTPDVNPGDGIAADVDGYTSLRAAVMEGSAQYSTISIFLPVGVYHLSLGALNFNTVFIFKITGEDQDETIIDAGSQSRIFSINNTELHLAQLSLANGSNEAVRNYHGSLFLDFVKIYGSSSSAITCYTGSVEIYNSTLENNSGKRGAALYVDDSFLSLRNCGLYGNISSGISGAIYSVYSTVSVRECSITGNVSELGGGILLLTLGDSLIVNCTISDNQGVGFVTDSNESKIYGCTIVNNVGGGVFAYSAELGNNVIADNVAEVDPDLQGTFTSMGGNLIGDGGSVAGQFQALGDLVGNSAAPIDPMLMPLDYNEGTTLTHMPMPGSPVIDSGVAFSKSSGDQRGHHRPQDGDGDGIPRVDRGAIEVDQPIVLISPDGIESLTVNRPYTITWETHGGTDNINIDLSYDDGDTWSSLFADTPDDGQELWTPNALATDLLVRVSLVNSPEVQDICNVPVNVSLLGIYEPNGGEIKGPSSGLQIRWDSSASTGPVDISLSRDGGVTWEIIANNTENDGTYVWLVTGVKSGECKIRVKSKSQPDIFGESNGYFTIKPGTLSIISPNGEQYYPGKQMRISWHGQYNDPVEIDVSFNGGATWENLPLQPVNRSVYWYVAGPSPGNGLIRVRSLVNPEEFDVKPFTIPFFEMTYPVGGEVLAPASFIDIQWVLPGFTGVYIQLSRDGGTTWNTLKSTSNSGAYRWQVTGPGTTNALFRVASKTDPTIHVISPQFVTILDPHLTLTYPNGGETIGVGSSLSIDWNGSNYYGNTRIELSRDNGQSWSLLEANGLGGHYTWQVTGPPTSYALIRVSAKVFSALYDVSNAAFSISGLSLLSPNGGEVLQVGTSTQIQWNLPDVPGGVNISLSRDGGTTWSSLASNAPNSGTYSWQVTGPNTAQARFRVASVTNPALVGTSAGFVTITSPLLVKPNGGEALLVGTVQSIEWSGISSSNVMIELSRNQGQTWEMITSSTANDGQYSWQVTGATTTTALIRISATEGPSSFDVSDAVFSITKLTMLYPNGGETLIPPTPINITWDTAGQGGSVHLSISRDNGVTWTLIKSGWTNTGSYRWQVTEPGTLHAKFRVVFKQAPTVMDDSDGESIITQPSMELQSPVGNESVTIGQRMAIKYSGLDFYGSVRIELSRNSGTSWEVISSSTSNTGTYNWTVSGPTTTQAIIRVSAKLLPTTYDQSPLPFTIN